MNNAIFQLETQRLILVQTPVHVLRQRLQQETFQADVPLQQGMLSVHFPPEWPGDALAMFPQMLAYFSSRPEERAWGGTLIERTEQVAIGQMGFKGPPNSRGIIEIGYGINPGYWQRGYATEMVRALVDWALVQPSVRCVTAECRVDNIGSIRVLGKSEFQRVGRRFDIEEGDLILWQRTT
jgi:[ribosomal protein S5]-alanine N-acetyltransferase